MQMITAHNSAVTANTFSPDGKYLATYSCNENRLSFWQVRGGAKSLMLYWFLTSSFKNFDSMISFLSF